MSTQNESGIEFAILPEEEYQHFRLLELPPELLTLLTSENAPILRLKATEGPPGHSLESNASLCTLDKTYNLRQVSTSNSLFITQTVEHCDGSENNMPQLRLDAIGKSTSTLEVNVDRNGSAKPYIKAALPVYTSTGHTGSQRAMTKRQLFDDIPLSEAECEAAWNELACFELAHPPRCLIPSPAIRWSTWQICKTVADAENLDLTGHLTDAHRAVMANEDAELPSELVYAVLRSVSATWTDQMFEIDSRKCARFVGVSLLRQRTERGGATSTREFLDAWKENLPRSWEQLAAIELLSPSCQMQSGGQIITFVEDDDASVNSSAATEAKSTLGAKRKWHEKFRAAKKVS